MNKSMRALVCSAVVGFVSVSLAFVEASVLDDSASASGFKKSLDDINAAIANVNLEL